MKEFTQEELLLIINCLNDERFKVRNELNRENMDLETYKSKKNRVQLLTNTLNKVYKAFGV